MATPDWNSPEAINSFYSSWGGATTPATSAATPAATPPADATPTTDDGTGNFSGRNLLSGNTVTPSNGYTPPRASGLAPGQTNSAPPNPPNATLAGLNPSTTQPTTGTNSTVGNPSTATTGTAPPSTAVPSAFTDLLTGKPFDPTLYASGPYDNPLYNYDVALNSWNSQGGANMPQPVTSPFSQSPFATNPTESNPLGGTTPLNPQYIASQDTANRVASMFGGTVVPTQPLNTSGGFAYNQPQYMVKLADGTMVNPADVADLYSHGYSQSYINQGYQTMGLTPPASTPASATPNIAQLLQGTANPGPTTTYTATAPTGTGTTPPATATTPPAGTPQGSGADQGAQQQQLNSLVSLLSLLSGSGNGSGNSNLLNQLLGSQSASQAPASGVSGDLLSSLAALLSGVFGSGGSGNDDLYSRSRQQLMYPRFP